MKTQFSVVIDNDDGPARDLTARATGGGHGNQWRCPIRDFQ